MNLSRWMVISALTTTAACTQKQYSNEYFVDKGFVTIESTSWTKLEGCLSDQFIDGPTFYLRRKAAVVSFLKEVKGLDDIETVYDLDWISLIQRKRTKDTVLLNFLFAEPALEPDAKTYTLIHGGIYVRFDVCRDFVLEGGEYRAR